MSDSTIAAIGKNPLYSVTGPIGSGMAAMFIWLYSTIGNIETAIEDLDDNQVALSQTVAVLSATVEAIDGSRDTQIRADLEAFKADATVRLNTCEAALDELKQSRRRR